MKRSQHWLLAFSAFLYSPRILSNLSTFYKIQNILKRCSFNPKLSLKKLVSRVVGCLRMPKNTEFFRGWGPCWGPMLIGGTLIHTPVMLKYVPANLFHLYKLRKRSNGREATTIIFNKICRKVTVGPAALQFPCMSSASFEFSGTLRFGRYANHTILSPRRNTDGRGTF